MRSVGLLLSTVSLATYVACWQNGHRDIFHDTFGHDSPHNDIQKRNIVYDGQIAESYDFVVVGGGTAGLALAARLSEDSNSTVLVLEAGDTGDAVKEKIDPPGDTYWTSLLYSEYDWQYKTVVQPGAGNRAIAWPRGKVLGGSSAVNGMYQVRPSKVEVDKWASMVDGGDIWSWDNLYAAMKKGENFTAPSTEIQTEGDIEYVAASHGNSGPLHVTYPGFIVPVVGNWTDTLANVGIPANDDPNSGEGWGGFIASSAINPSNWTRSYSRSAYIDPLPPRSNLAILPNSTVTRIIFTAGGSDLTANSVEYASSRDAARVTVNVTKEVILAGGAVGSPHVLLHSGIGPKDVLSSVDIPVLYELPGVGQHLQDHISTELVFTTDDDTAASLHTAELSTLPTDGESNAFLSFVNSATCYANISSLFGEDDYQSFIANVSSALDSSVASLVPSTDPTVIAGYKAIYNATLELLSTPIGQVEILMSLTGSSQAGDKGIAIQAALQHPFSQGRLYINSSDPFDYPVIDPQYGSHFADKIILREGLKLARKIGNTAPLNSAIIEEVFPGSSIQTDDDWDNWLVDQYGTEFHPSCSLAMLPLDLGGVVDANLKVYGTSNVRVVDASVFPIQWSAHMMAPVYGLAEQAATMIRDQYNGVTFQVASGTTNSSSSSSSTDASKSSSVQTEQNNSTSSNSTAAANGASWTRPQTGVALVALLAGVSAML